MRCFTRLVLALLFVLLASCRDSPIGIVPTMPVQMQMSSSTIEIESISGQLDPVAVNTPVQITAFFNGADPEDTHTAVIRWGDGASSIASVDETEGTATATRSYVLPGVYTAVVEIRNQNEATGTGTFEYVTVYNPDGGYVSGAGAILSPAGACTRTGCIADEGTARFGFSSRYRRGAHVPDGNTRFTFRDGNFTFTSTAYEWLVISGARAQYKGTGTVNREGDYGFMLTAIDSERPGGGDEDRFRIRIWDRSNDVVVYDNQRGSDDGAGLTHAGTTLTRGKITIRSTTRNTAPVVVITSPADGATFSDAEEIRLAATAGDAEDGDLSGQVVWSSDVDGELGTGAELHVGLQPGVHAITASATDSGGLEGSASIALEILEVVYTISVAPVDATIDEGETQQFTATVFADGVEMTEGIPTITWTSSVETVATVDEHGLATGLSPGEATITATILDDVEDSAVLTVKEGSVDLEIVSETISAGSSHSCGLDLNGNAHCWGLNSSGQLGTGNNTNRDTPGAVAMPHGVAFVSISAGGSHTLALTAAGIAYSWGEGGNGRLGHGALTSSNTPIPVAMPDDVSFAMISAGGSHSVALTSTGTAYAWGFNNGGQLGDASYIDRNRPVAVQMPAGVSFASISAGLGHHTLAISSAGDAWAWGSDSYGQLGYGFTGSPRRAHDTPVAVDMPAGVVFASISAGVTHSVALATTGTAYAWGRNNHGQAGDGSSPAFPGSNDRPAPVQVMMPDGVSFASLRAGDSHTLALTTDGGAYAWGFNAYGTLGDGSTDPSNTPVPVSIPPGVTFHYISAGALHNLALSTTGVAYAWGAKTYGMLGIGTVSPWGDQSQPEPTAVLGGIQFEQ